MSTKKRACVVVLGDIGRSPRMQYHALSLSKVGYNVDLVGYSGSAPHSQLVFNEKIALHFMRQPPQFQSMCPRMLSYFLKVMWQSVFLFLSLFWSAKPDFILVQNPPSVPTLPVCWFVCWLRGVPLVIDWHNYGYTILSLTLGPRHLLVLMSRLIEKKFGRKAQSNLCVTKAMSADLQQNWGITATTLYDRPAEMFRPIELSEKHELFMKLSRDHSQFSSSKPDANVLTERFADGQVRLCEDRPGLLVSSTSWTEDEDFSILLEALEEYESKRADDRKYPPLLCVITGKGPLKEYYVQVIAAKEWQHVEVCTPWLEPEDYPKLIACADLGVCLHKSSSGLDLPMKVVDMFGCGLPVCAIQYSCLNELVRDGENGMTFNNSAELATQILQWFEGFPRHEKRRQAMRDGIKAFRQVGWHSSWLETALPVLSTDQ